MKDKLFSRFVPILFVLIFVLGVVQPTNAHHPSNFSSAGVFTNIAAGYDHTCALTNAGGVKCWGSNSSGQLGNGTNASQALPVDVSGLTSGVIAITAGASYSCALTSVGGVKCWGTNWSGQLGNGTTNSSNTPVNVSTLTSGVSALSAGYSHACALTNIGGVKCWGNNSYGKLGNGTTTDVTSPVDVTGLVSGVTSIAAAYGHTCALVDGNVKCWGLNDAGQLGNGSNNNSSTPISVMGLTTDTLLLATGGKHSCASSSLGVKCWGSNTYGQLGDGTFSNQNIPVTVTGSVNGITSLVANGFYDSGHTCVITSSAGVKCWGANLYGQIGNGTTVNNSTPTDVIGLVNVSSIATGDYHSCAIVDSSVFCWGSNSSGQLGDGTITWSNIPADVTGLSNGVTVFGTGDWHTCAVVEGQAKCWGNNRSGQLGYAAPLGSSSLPLNVTVPGLGAGFTAVDGELDKTCALVSGIVQCWSQGFVSTVPGLSSAATSLSSTYVHSCTIDNGGAKCWGMNNHGQLGNGTTNGSSDPVDVLDLNSEVNSIATGAMFSCGVVNGGVRCWGLNSAGQLGDGTTTEQLVPVPVVNLGSGVVQVVAAQNHTCALTTSGGVKCWGGNESGQLGDGSYNPSLIPVNVLGLTSGVTAITAASNHTCALTIEGGVKCWGGNQNGQLGDGTTSYQSTPVYVTGLSMGVVAITAGGLNYQGHTCALTITGGVKCWGDNKYGQLGDNTPILRTTPVRVIGMTSQPELGINFETGQPGSYFRLVGANFPVNSIANIFVNDKAVGTVTTTSNGSFLFFVSTEGAAPGPYQIVATVNPTASTTFNLTAGAPLRLKEGSGAVFIAVPRFVFLPLIQR